MRLQSLRSKLVVAVSALVIGSGLLISLLVTHRYSRSVLKAATAQAENLAHALAIEATDKVLINDLVALQKMLDHQMRSNPSVAYLFIIRDEKVLAHTFTKGVPVGLINANDVLEDDHGHFRKIASTRDEHYLDIAWPIFSGKAGVLRLGLSEKPYRRQVTRLWLQMSALSLGILLLALAGTLLFVRRITSPLAALAQATQKVDKGELSARVQVQGQDEVATLASSFNHMVARMEEYTRRLEEQTMELERASEYLLGIVENSANLIITVNPDGYIETFNRGAEKILGYDRSEVIGKRIEILFARPEERDVAIRQLKVRDNVANYETQFLRKDRTPVDIILTLSRLRDSKGNPIGTFGISKDVTEYKRLQNQLIQSERLAAIGQASASIIHSIKNILNSLKGGSYMIKTGLGKNDLELAREGWGVAQTGIDRISELAKDMLDFTKTQKSSIEPGSINDVVAEVCLAMTKTPEAQNVVHLTWDLDEGIPPVIVDRKAIFNAVMNLISNAIDACIDHEYESEDHQWVKVRTYLETDNGHVCIEVKDNGGGISDELKERIFSPFFSTKFNKGTGLGLTITMKIIREHKGTLLLDTLPGQGSTFTIKLPVIRQEEDNKN